MLDGAFLKNISGGIFGTPFTDLRRSLLGKYSRIHNLGRYSQMLDGTFLENIPEYIIWDAIHKCWMELPCKIFYSLLTYLE